MLFATPHKLIFVALLLMHYGVDGVQIKELSSRGRGHGDGPGPASSSTGPINTSPSNGSPLPSRTSSTSAINTSPSNGSPLPSRSSSTSATRAGTPLSSIISASSLAASASSSEDRSAESRQVGTIVGAVLGSVILASLGLMTVAHFRRRARIARKRPRSSSYFDEPTTEMSQTRNGPPLTSSAPLVHSPAPLHFFNGSSTNNTSSSLSPLIPAATFHESLDATSSFRRQTGVFDGNFNVPSDPSQSPFDTHPLILSSLDSPRLERAVLAGPASSSTSGQLSPLHRDMAGFQKRLEADHKRDQSNESTIISDPISDPPPKYIG